VRPLWLGRGSCPIEECMSASADTIESVHGLPCCNGKRTWRTDATHACSRAPETWSQRLCDTVTLPFRRRFRNARRQSISGLALQGWGCWLATGVASLCFLACGAAQGGRGNGGVVCLETWGGKAMYRPPREKCIARASTVFTGALNTATNSTRVNARSQSTCRMSPAVGPLRPQTLHANKRIPELLSF